MTWVFIEQQRHVPATVVVVDNSEKSLEVFLFLVISNEQQTFACFEIHCPKYDSPSVPAGDQHFGWYTPATPGCPF